MAFSPQQVNGSPGWQWPDPIRSVKALVRAMRDGFELRQLPDSSHFGLYRDGQRSPRGVFDEAYAVGAMRRGLVGIVGKLDDGSILFKLTIKASDIHD